MYQKPNVLFCDQDFKLCISITGSYIDQVNEVKLLGVNLHSKLSGQKCRDEIVGKMRRMMSMIRRCSSFLTPNTTWQVIQALVLISIHVRWSGQAQLIKSCISSSCCKIEQRVSPFGVQWRKTEAKGMLSSPGPKWKSSHFISEYTFQNDWFAFTQE